MSGFFTLPALQRKRKRQETSTSAAKKRQIPSKAQKLQDDDESIASGSSSGSASPLPSSNGSDSEEDDAGETAAERRLKLAEQYLENIRAEVGGDEIEFDAEDVDRELIAARLKEDVAEEKGRLHRYIAESLDLSKTSQSFQRADTLATCGIAACPPYLYTASKDMRLIKWELAPPPSKDSDTNGTAKAHKHGRPGRRKPKQLLFTCGNKNKKNDVTYQHHTAAILCVAASADGRFVATGGADRRLIVWDAATLSPLKVFAQHRDAVTSLAFRGKTNQLFSASKDRTVKIWSLNELAYVETLFGHQDEVVDIAAIGGTQERCVSVGARDRTARLWKVVEESQLVFRGGGTGAASTKRERERERAEQRPLELVNGHEADEPRPIPPPAFSEGSLDRVTQIDTQLFVTGSDSGAISLYKIDRKKALHVYVAAHGYDAAPSAAQSSADDSSSPVPVPNSNTADKTPNELLASFGPHANKVNAQPTPRWITALKAIPYTDLFVSGSWDGYIRLWRITGADAAGSQRKIEPVGILGANPQPNHPSESATNGQTSLDEHSQGVAAAGGQTPPPIKGIINDLALFPHGERGQDGVCIVAGVGSETRLGRWKQIKGGKNGALVYEVAAKQ